MKPNIEGGQLFEPNEVGVLRNVTWQASRAMDRVDPTTANEGNAPTYNKLRTQLGPLHPRAGLGQLSTDVKDLEEKVAAPECNKGFGASIGQTQLVMACLRWAVENPDQLTPLATSSEQLVQAQAMLASFAGHTAAANTSQ